MAAAAKINFQSVKRELDAKEYRPLYILHGDEDYYIDVLCRRLEEEVVPPENRDFDLTILYGNEASVKDAVFAAKRFPMMSEKNVVILKEAQSAKNVEALDDYISHAPSSSILVICYKHGKIDSKRTFMKNAAKCNALVFESVEVYDSAVPTFVENYVKAKNHTITPEASQLLISHTGKKLSRIADELDKLIISIGESSKPIDEDTVSKIVGISKEFNVRELLNAVIKKDIFKANQIALVVGGDKVALPPIIAIFFGFFRDMMYYWKYLRNTSDDQVAAELKINPYFVRQYKECATHYDAFQVLEVISILATYDAKSKGVDVASGITQSELLQEMIYMIMHCNGRNDAFQLD